ncbi:FlgO family outer membrane protein [Comamonas faecalis]|uniref:FlgO family outer membrane protein n=1 Tax=Comamonas faecalis TaxID=1387849 RepID=UPI0031E60164
MPSFLIWSRRRRAAAVLACAVALALPGCARYYYGDAAQLLERADLLQASASAVDALLAGGPLAPGALVRVLPPRPLGLQDDADAPLLGQVLAQQLAARLVQRRLRVQEAIAAPDGRQAPVAAILAGSYVRAERQVFVQLRLLSADSGEVLAAHGDVLALDADVRALLQR